MGSGGPFVGHVVFHVVLVLQYTTAGAVNETELPCLCLFDVDRTLTGKQNLTRHCSHNKVISSVNDTAWGGGLLTLSELAQNLDKTFCLRCHMGIISKGDVGGDGSEMRPFLVALLNKNKPQELRVHDTWAKFRSDDKVKAPLVYGVPNGHKHHVAEIIRDWYLNHMKIHIFAAQTHFFDDEAKNIEEFKGFDYNALQVSCNSRDSHKDDLIGWCGAVTSEGVPRTGVHVCPTSRRRSLAFSDMPTSPEDTGALLLAETFAKTDSLEDEEEEEEEEDEMSENDVAGPPRRRRSWSCSGQRRRYFNNHMHVYRMRFRGEPKGVKDRDAASLNGIYELLTGGAGSSGVKTGWGLNRYYHADGIMEVTYISYTAFGTYQSCNAQNPGVPGSPHHCQDCYKPHDVCCCSSRPSLNLTSLSVLPGRLSTSYTGGEWYSFNGAGYGKTWHQFECPSFSVKMTTLVDKLSEHGKCGKCSLNVVKCAECLRRISTATREKVFDALLQVKKSSKDAVVIV
jgi:hypothetical protein